ncbi:protein piccolo-like isoform X4 [Ruditapes philippinarum]|uniref:protein piccolo-like isoform X4 n=1 Tax=Ruditapes philippinarum TaxID=129788 RepID=UPI00295B2621|nr:protein piccolo-like isoform X4 [Ruditapes philippinarum]
MDRIKSQREEWITSQSMMDVGEGQQQYIRSTDSTAMNGDHFYPLLPDESPMSAQNEVSPSPEKLARVHSPVQATRAPSGHPAAPPADRKTPMPPNEFAEKLMSTNEKQQTNVQIHSAPTQTVTLPSDRQQAELAEIMRQQEIMMEQKRQLELKLQQLTYEQQKMKLMQQAQQAQEAATQQPPQQQFQGAQLPHQIQMPQPPMASAPGIPPPSYNQYTAQTSHPGPIGFQSFGQPGQPMPYPGTSAPPTQPFQYPNAQSQVPTMVGQPHVPFPQPSQFPSQPVDPSQQPASSAQQQFASSLSSNASGMSQRPMNSIPPTHTTGTAPLMTSQGHGYPGFQGQQSYSSFQQPSAVLTADQLAAPAWQQPTSQPGYPGSVSMAPTSLQSQTVSPGHIPPASLTSQGMSDQMKKVKEYQEHLLARHEQSKKVLDETKAEIKRRRENLLERYPNLDLSRLEELGAKHLDTQPRMSSAAGQESQGQSVPVTSLLASLAAHPYYAATLSQPGTSRPTTTTSDTQGTVATVGHVQANNIPTHPDINLETNLRKNKLENIRKSLPFDADDSFQTPVRVYEAYAQNHLDLTSATDITETDVSSLTERGSPSLKPAPRAPIRPEAAELGTTTEESDVDTTASSFMAEKDELSSLRQNEIKHQLEEIKRQKDEIIRRHQQGQQKLQSKEEELKAKLATLQPEQITLQLRESLRLKQLEKQQNEKDLNQQDGRQHSLNLSTIIEIDTPASTRHSEAGMSGSTHSEASQQSKKALDFSRKETIQEVPEKSILEEVETQMQSQAKAKAKRETVADYSGKNIDDVLERAKRFEQEVLQKLRKQTNAVLFDNEFDDSLEFSVSRRHTSADPLSSGSLTPSSFSTGPLDETSQSRQSRTGDGSFQTGSNWATELSQFKIPPSNQSDLAFKVMKPDASKSTEKKPSGEATLFTGDKSRFKVYSDINGPEAESDTSKSESSSLEDSKMDSVLDSLEPDSMNAGAMLKHLKTLQEQLRKGEEERNMLAKKLADQQNKTPDQSREDLTQYSMNSSENVSRPFMPEQDTSDLSQYSFTDKSTDVSMAGNDQSEKGKKSHNYPIQSGTSSVEKELLVRRSPIGDSAKVEPHSGLTNGREPQDATATEYSFALSESKQQRSTSTPGDGRRKSALNGTHFSELPSEITVGDKTNGKPDNTIDSTSSKFKSPGQRTELSSYSMSYDSTSGRSEEFNTLSPDRNGKTPTDSVSRHSGMTAEESLESIKKEFEKLEKPENKVKTFAVNRDGDLISEHSDSDKSLRNSASQGGQDFTQYTISSQGSGQDKSASKLESFSGLTSYTLPETTGESRLTEYSNKSSFGSGSVSSNPKSSSFTNVTSDPSLNMTNATNLSQYTLNDSEVAGENVSDNNNYVQQRFASLDNLISESKNIIAKHKQIISKNKNSEEDVPKLSSKEKSSAVPNITSGLKSSEKQTVMEPPKPEPRSNFLRSRLNKVSEESKTDSTLSHQQTSLSQDDSSRTRDKSGNQSSTVDESSLDYLAEHSSGITEEQLPDMTTMTMGSEISISEAFNKTEEFSDSTDSLKSFEKHEMSESESASFSQNFDDDSLRDTSKSDSLQEIVEARRHNFMVQTERRAAAAKERALAAQRTETGHQVFRAVPVNVVREPTLSMSVSSAAAERGKSPTTVQSKGANLFSTEKKYFELKEKEASTSSSSKPLNRALQPRGWEPPKTSDCSSKSHDGGAMPRETSLFSKFGTQSKTTEETKSPRSPRGRLAGEIRQFGGSAGLYQKPSPPTPKKTPPKVAPKPVRPKPEERQPAKPTSGLSKTLSSWKKSRAVTGPSKLPEPVQQREALKNSIRVLPEEAPPALTEEERRKRAEDELYEKNIRAYNPRLFRLQHRLDREDSSPETSPQQQQQEKQRDAKKKRRRRRRKQRESVDNLRKNNKI